MKKTKYGFETAAPDRYLLLKEFAKYNRREMTICEEILWHALRHDIQGIRFRRQHPIGDYIVDFVCLPEKLVIEIDGGYHTVPEQQASDENRTEYLNSRGFTVIRFRNEEVMNEPKMVINRIKNLLFNK